MCRRWRRGRAIGCVLCGAPVVITFHDFEAVKATKSKDSCQNLEFTYSTNRREQLMKLNGAYSIFNSKILFTNAPLYFSVSSKKPVFYVFTKIALTNCVKKNIYGSHLLTLPFWTLLSLLVKSCKDIFILFLSKFTYLKHFRYGFWLIDDMFLPFFSNANEKKKKDVDGVLDFCIICLIIFLF